MRPGLHISMSMVFRLEERQTAQCPSCGEENAGSDLEEIEWYIFYYSLEETNANEHRSGNTICGITYRKIVEKPGPEPQFQGPSQANPSTNHEMQYYTRLHIVTQATVNGVEYKLGAGNFDSIGSFTADEKVDEFKSREDEPSVSSEDRPLPSQIPLSAPVPETNRWEQIRKNAAERMRRRGVERFSRLSRDKFEDGEKSDDESKSSIISTIA